MRDFTSLWLSRWTLVVIHNVAKNSRQFTTQSRKKFMYRKKFVMSRLNRKKNVSTMTICRACTIDCANLTFSFFLYKFDKFRTAILLLKFHSVRQFSKNIMVQKSRGTAFNCVDPWPWPSDFSSEDTKVRGSALNFPLRSYRTL